MCVCASQCVYNEPTVCDRAGHVGHSVGREVWKDKEAVKNMAYCILSFTHWLWKQTNRSRLKIMRTTF